VREGGCDSSSFATTLLPETMSREGLQNSYQAGIWFSQVQLVSYTDFRFLSDRVTHKKWGTDDRSAARLVDATT